MIFEPLIDTAIALLAVAAFILWLMWRGERELAERCQQDVHKYLKNWLSAEERLRLADKELSRLQGIIDGMAERIAAQSELLSQRAKNKDMKTFQEIEDAWMRKYGGMK